MTHIQQNNNLNIVDQTDFFHLNETISQHIEINYTTIKFPATCSISLLNLKKLRTIIEQHESVLYVAQLLSKEEYKLWNSFSYKKRRLQWLGGRLTTKHAIFTLLHNKKLNNYSNYSDLSILPELSGRPQLSCDLVFSIKKPSISLSHSDHLAVAIAADNTTCGIDIQKVTDRIINVQEKFTNKTELEMLQYNTRQLCKEEQLTLMWACKEAVKKCLLHDQPAFFSGINLLDTSSSNPYLLQFHIQIPNVSNDSVTVQALQIKNFFIAFTQGVNNHA